MKVRLKEDIGSGAVYEGRFLDPSDAKTFTEQLNQKAGGSMEVIFNLNRGGGICAMCCEKRFLRSAAPALTALLLAACLTGCGVLVSLTGTAETEKPADLLDLSRFYRLGDTEYGVGTLELDNGTAAYIGMMRP